MPEIPARWRLKQEHCAFEALLDDRLRLLPSAGSLLPAIKVDNTPRFLSAEALSGDGQGHPRSGTACPGGPLESSVGDLAVSPAWLTQERAQERSLAGTATCSAGTERPVLYYSRGRATAPGLLITQVCP